MKKTFDILVRIEILLVILVVFFGLAIIINLNILPNYGYYFDSSMGGESMLPTLRDGALVLEAMPSVAPFNSLQVGDIVGVKEPKQLPGYSIKMSITIGDSGVGETVYDPVDRTLRPRDDGIEYRAKEGRCHRIVEIREASEEYDRAIYTKGDNNPSEDQFPTLESGYSWKLVWSMNYIGWPFLIVVHYGGYYWLLGLMVLLIPVLMLLSHRMKKVQNDCCD